jgi:glycosyltransferase involved in cell wall biosynthesis
MAKSKKSNAFISIVVPIYNTDKYLRQCVDSIIGQTFSDFELILVDDGSSDKSPKICDSYARKDDRVTVIHQPNGGQTKARKAGLNVAKGEYIYFVDSDDWLELNALDVVCKCAVDNNADIVTFDNFFNYSDHQIPTKQPVPSGCFDKKGMIEHIYPRMIYSGRFFYFGIYAAMWNKIFRRSILTPNMINVDERIKLGEDGVTTFATFLDAERICVLSGQYLYHYRDNNISLTRSYCRDQLDSALLLIRTLQDINKRKNVYDLSSQINYYLAYNVRSIFNEEFYYRYKKSFISRYKYLRRVAQDPFVQETFHNISTDGISGEPKRFIELLQKGKINLLVMTTIRVAGVMRVKLLVRKILKRY